jgi:hypothetical protein
VKRSAGENRGTGTKNTVDAYFFSLEMAEDIMRDPPGRWRASARLQGAK